MERATGGSLKGHTPFLVIYRRNFLASWLILVDSSKSVASLLDRPRDSLRKIVVLVWKHDTDW